MGISIKNQCSEDWNRMSSAEKGAFCLSCKKEVIDFSGMNSNEIKSTLKSNLNESTCGRFDKKQLIGLNEEFEIWQRTNTQKHHVLFIFSLFLVFGLALFSCENESKVKEINRFRSQVHAVFDNSTNAPEVIKEKSPKSQSEFKKPLDTLVVEENVTLDDLEEPVTYHVDLNLGDTSKNVVDVGQIEFPTDRIQMLGLVVTLHHFDDFLEDTVSQEAITSIESIAYPNPCINRTTLKVETTVEFNSTIQLVDLNGRILKEIPNTEFKVGVNEIELDLTASKSGLYLIRLITPLENKTIKIRKI